MKVLTYAILGLLNRTAMTGYDISKAFNHELAKFWHAKHSQIYGELKSMFNDGLVTTILRSAAIFWRRRSTVLPRLDIRR